jgi:hypothetical protein
MEKNINEMWPFLTHDQHPDAVKNELKDLENKAYKSIDNYRKMLLIASKEQGETDNDIHHDIIKKNQEHKNLVEYIAGLFSKVHDYEKDSEKLKPSFFSDTFFEKIARYAKRMLGYHADEIADILRKINPASLDDLFNIWRPGSWAESKENINFKKFLESYERTTNQK